MIAGYEVGATLSIIDRATGPLSTMLKLVQDLTASVERLKPLMTGLFAETGIRSFNTQLEYAERRMGPLADRINVVRSEMEGLTEAAVAAAAAVGDVGLIGAAGVGAAAAGGGGGGGSRSAGAGAGFAAGKFWSRAGLVGAAGSLGSIYEGASMESTIARSLIALNIPIVPGHMMDMPEAKRLRDTMQSMADYGVNAGDVREATLSEIRTSYAGDVVSAGQRLDLLPAVLKFAALEHIQKGASMEEGVNAAMGIAHQLRAYTPQDIEKRLGSFAQMSMTTDQSLNALMQALSYSLPTGTIAQGVDPDQIIAAVGAGSRMGLRGKSGTWLSTVMQHLFPTAGLTGHQAQAQLTGLAQLGLVDAKGQSTALNAAGGMDLVKAMTILSEHIQRMSYTDRARAFKDAFQITGSREAALLSDPTVLRILTDSVRAQQNARPVSSIMNDIRQNDPMLAFTSTWEQLKVVLMDIGTEMMTVVLPPMRALSSLLKGLHNHPVLEGALGVGMGGLGLFKLASMLGAGGLMKSALGFVGRNILSYGGAGLMTAGAAGAEGAMALGPMIVSALPIIIPLVIAAVAAYGIYKLAYSDSKSPIAPGGSGGGGARGGAGHPMVHVENLTLQMPQGTPHTFMDDLANTLRTGLSHATSAAGSFTSAFLSGGSN